MADLDHDHREREDIRFLTALPLVQNLWCGPSQGVAVLTRSAPYGIDVLSDLSEAEIRDACTTGVFHENVELVRCQRGVKRGSAE